MSALREITERAVVEAFKESLDRTYRRLTGS
jgi:hypothetical protein